MKFQLIDNKVTFAPFMEGMDENQKTLFAFMLNRFLMKFVCEKISIEGETCPAVIDCVADAMREDYAHLEVTDEQLHIAVLNFFGQLSVECIKDSMQIDLDVPVNVADIENQITEMTENLAKPKKYDA